jgi:predicted  nucleic acid-binding Zn-ribbon protein
VESLNSQFSNYAENLSSIEKKVGTGESERKDIVSRIDAVKSDMAQWQKDYAAIMAELKDRTEILKTNVEQLAKGITEQVNLGKISVKGSSAPAAEPAQEEEPAASSASASNFGPRR